MNKAEPLTKNQKMLIAVILALAVFLSLVWNIEAADVFTVDTLWLQDCPLELNPIGDDCDVLLMPCTTASFARVIWYSDTLADSNLGMTWLADENGSGMPASVEIRKRVVEGDCNGDGSVDVGDFSCLVNLIFGGGDDGPEGD